MKRFFCYFIALVLVLGLVAGCNKKNNEKEINSGEVEQNQENIENMENKETSQELETIDYIIYVRYKDKPFLYDEVFSIDINDEKIKDKSIEEFVLSELINYEEYGEFANPIPEGTKVLEVAREGNSVIVNFSKEFASEEMNSNQALLTIASVVNTLTALPGNETVRIKIEGQMLENYFGVDTSKPMHFIEGLFPDK